MSFQEFLLTAIIALSFILGAALLAAFLNKR